MSGYMGNPDVSPVTQGGYPVTPGYTINIVREKQEEPAVILLNSAQSSRGSKTFYITLPPSSAQDRPGQIVSEKLDKSVKRKVSDEDIFYFVEDSTEEVISSEVIVEEDGSFIGEIEIDNASERVVFESVSPVKETSEEETVFYEERTYPYSDPSVFFTEVAHEEIVIEEVLSDPIVEERQRPGVKTSQALIPYVQCDLCNSKLQSAEAAKDHMRLVHNILTYEGPFFKCEFCGIFVTDRVSHMKVAHYSPLAQAFCKTNNSYQCLQCDYTSDQLTNIRNHVDAKHSSGENKYLCEECNSEYKTLNSMRAHKSRVHVKKRRMTELGQLTGVRGPLASANRQQKTVSKFNCGTNFGASESPVVARYINC